MRIRARKLLGYSTEQLWNILTGEVTLIFEDGEIQTNCKEIVYNSYVWDFHRRYPTAPLLKNHHVGAVLKGGRLSASTHLRLIGNVLWDTYDHLCITMHDPDHRLNLRFELAKIAYEITNQMYNDLCYRLEEYVTSLDIVDFMEVLDHPALVKGYDELEPNHLSIKKLYDTIDDTLRDKKAIGHNTLSKLVRSGLVNDKQVQQCIGPRGFLTDTDSMMYHEPILRGYVEGIRTFYDSLIESRSASKSLAFSKGPLQDAEYFSRRLQVVVMTVQNLHHVDCGSEQYLLWHIRDKQMIEDEVVYEGDFNHLIGKYFWDESIQKVRDIKKSDTHLIGKTVKLRSILHCAHPDPVGVCRVCFGLMADSVPPHSNLGHMCAAYMTQQSSQSVLSLKHADGSTTIVGILIEDGDKPFIRSSLDGNEYLLSNDLIGKPVKLIIKSADAGMMTNIHAVDDIRDLSIYRISALKTLKMRVGDEENYIENVIPVHVKKRFSSMTYELLDYIREHGWEIDQAGDFIIDMKDWNWNKPILKLPMKHFNMSDHSKEIAQMLISSVDDTIERDRFVSPSIMLGDLFNLINEKLSVNLAIIEVIFYGFMIVSDEEGDYSLPKPWTKQGIGVMRNIIDSRSASAQMAFERHYDVIVDVNNYISDNRPDHVFDPIIMPREIL